jgi:hypothetical protein
MNKTYWYWAASAGRVSRSGIIASKTEFFPIEAVSASIDEVDEGYSCIHDYTIVFQISKEDFEARYARATKFKNTKEN